MAGRSEALIELAKGPYELKPGLGHIIVEKVDFRHFGPMETKVAKAFIRRELLYGTYYFDVYLLTREAIEWMKRYPEKFWRMGIPYAHRIDAVCFTPTEVYVIEFKVRLSYSAIGQTLGYVDWFKRQYRPTKPVIPCIVVLLARPELNETVKKHRIKYFELVEL